VLLDLASASAFSLAAGLIQALLALLLWRQHQTRRAWGLQWQAVAFLLGALVSAGVPLLLAATAARELRELGPGWQVLQFLAGFSSLGALLVGIRLYAGVARPAPWVVMAGGLTAVLAVALGLRPWLPETSGDLAASLLFVHCAWVAWRAHRREPGAGFGLLTVVLLLQPATVALALAAGSAGHAVRHIAAVPYAMAGLTLLAVSLHRYNGQLARELSARLQAERDLRQLNETLEQRVHLRTRELEDVVQGLESFNRMVSHDLRSPLAGLAGLSSLLLSEVNAQDNPRLHDRLRLMASQSERLARLVQDLLCLCRVGQAPLAQRPGALDQALAEALHTLSLSLPPSALSHVHAGDLPPLHVDLTLMTQVFVNLIGNALKFSASVPEPRVEVSACCERGEWRVTVADNGPGFDPAQGERLFQPFERLHGDIEGSGLGLSIVRRIVERHGGRVWADAKPGAGARFSFALPAL
jgi:signal transduction histidine kinase